MWVCGRIKCNLLKFLKMKIFVFFLLKNELFLRNSFKMFLWAGSVHICQHQWKTFSSWTRKTSFLNFLNILCRQVSSGQYMSKTFCLTSNKKMALNYLWTQCFLVSGNNEKVLTSVFSRKYIILKIFRIKITKLFFWARRAQICWHQ